MKLSIIRGRINQEPWWPLKAAAAAYASGGLTLFLFTSILGGDVYYGLAETTAEALIPAVLNMLGFLIGRFYVIPIGLLAILFAVGTAYNSPNFPAFLTILAFVIVNSATMSFLCARFELIDFKSGPS